MSRKPGFVIVSMRNQLAGAKQSSYTTTDRDVVHLIITCEDAIRNFSGAEIY